MAKRKGDYLVESRKDGWAVRRHKAKRASLVEDTKALAIDRAVSLARDTGGRIHVHDEDGKHQGTFMPDDDTMFLAFT